jgi:MFS family permease
MLPTYSRWGEWSIISLAILRIGQGVAQGGSWDGLPSLLALNAPQNKRGWYAMLGQLGAPTGFIIAAGLFSYLMAELTPDDFLVWGWRYPFYVAFAINVVALFARLRLVSTPDYTHLLDEHELDPAPARQVIGNQGTTIIIGALAALASYALFHLVTVFPLSWIQLYDTRSMADFLQIQMMGAGLAIVGVLASGLIADKFGRRNTLGTVAVLIALFAGFIPRLMDGGVAGQNTFIFVGFLLLGLSYGQAAGAVTSNFLPQYRYTGAALTSDLAWLVGAAFAPLVALGLAANFGLGYVSLYLLSGALGTLAALSVNRALEIRN